MTPRREEGLETVASAAPVGGGSEGERDFRGVSKTFNHFVVQMDFSQTPFPNEVSLTHSLYFDGERARESKREREREREREFF